MQAAEDTVDVSGAALRRRLDRLRGVAPDPVPSAVSPAVVARAPDTAPGVLSRV